MSADQEWQSIFKNLRKKNAMARQPVYRDEPDDIPEDFDRKRRRDRQDDEVSQARRREESGSVDPRASMLERMRRKQKEMEDRRGNFAKLKEGENVIRILPSWRGPNEEFYLEAATHYRVGPNRRTVPCLRHWNQACPICDRAEQMAASEDADMQERAQDLRPQMRIQVNILTENTPDGVVKVLSLPPSVFRRLIGLYFSAEGGDFTDPAEGFNVLISREGNGERNTRYPDVRLARRPTPIAKKGWSKELVNIDQLIEKNKMTRSQIMAVLRGEDTGDE